MNNPYYDFNSSEDSFVECLLGWLGDFGLFLWLLLLSPVGLLSAAIGWVTIDGVTFPVCLVLGGSTLVVGTLVSFIALSRLLFVDRKLEIMSKLSKRLFLLSAIFLGISTLSGSIAFCSLLSHLITLMNQLVA